MTLRSTRYAGQTITMTDAHVRFDQEGWAVGIVGRGFVVCDPPEPLDEAVLAKARRMPDRFEVVEPDETPEVEPTQDTTPQNAEPPKRGPGRPRKAR